MSDRLLIYLLVYAGPDHLKHLKSLVNVNPISHYDCKTFSVWSTPVKEKGQEADGC